MGALLKIYHHLPSFGRDMAVSVHLSLIHI